MARIFQNIGAVEVRIQCELVVPVGATSLPIELGGLVITDLGERAIAAAESASRLRVQQVDDLSDKVRPPAPPPGGIDVQELGVVDGQVLAPHVLQVTAASTDVTIGGHSCRQYPVLNENTMAAINVFAFKPLAVGARYRVSGVSTATFVAGGTTYRGAAAAAA